jgi:nitrate reductase delta subunit
VLTFRILAALLKYPSPELRLHLAEADRLLRAEGLLGAGHIENIAAFLRHLGDRPQLDLEAAWLDSFDRGRSTSLYLFEHIHGDSRERGEAMVKLLLRYRAHGLELKERELPDYLPLFLEFLSTRPAAEAAKHLTEVADIVALIAERLRRREVPYAPLLEALASLSGKEFEVRPSEADGVAERDDSAEALDAAWEEAPVMFNDQHGLTGAGAAMRMEERR